MHAWLALNCGGNVMSSRHLHCNLHWFTSLSAKPYFIGFVPIDFLICATSHNKNENRFRALGGHGLSATWYQSQSNSTLVWFFLFFIHKKSFFFLLLKRKTFDSYESKRKRKFHWRRSNELSSAFVCETVDAWACVRVCVCVCVSIWVCVCVCV